MNPYKEIEMMRNSLLQSKRDNEKSSKSIPILTHIDLFLNFLDLIETSLESACFNYQVLNSNIDEIKTFDELSLKRINLSDDVIIFQPIDTTENGLTAVDIQSLTDSLIKLKETSNIKENILLLPPNINIFRAVLSKEDN